MKHENRMNERKFAHKKTPGRKELIYFSLMKHYKPGVFTKPRPFIVVPF